jgi:hypothetical protein
MRSLIRGFGLAVLLPTIAAAQQVRGVVVEDSTFRPISDVRIEMVAADSTVLTSAFSTKTGWFKLHTRNGGRYVLRASHPAYNSIGVLAVEVGPQEDLTVVLRLNGGPIPIEPLVVKGVIHDRMNGYRERLRRGAYGKFITRADIDKLGGYSISHMLRFTPEVRIERVRDGPFTSEGLFMKSFGDLCQPSVFLDGWQVSRDRVIDINDLVSLEAIEGIEVYRSTLTAPMEFRMPSFGSDLECGVVALWTRVLPRPPLNIKQVLMAGFLVSSSVLVRKLFQ